jgi:hypothetical protein
LCPNCSNTKEAKRLRKHIALVNVVTGNTSEPEVLEPEEEQEHEWDDDKF